MYDLVRRLRTGLMHQFPQHRVRQKQLLELVVRGGNFSRGNTQWQEGEEHGGLA